MVGNFQKSVTQKYWPPTKNCVTSQVLARANLSGFLNTLLNSQPATYVCTSHTYVPVVRDGVERERDVCDVDV